jgi:glycosyltransferase involved in cell wall biosynthesis
MNSKVNYSIIIPHKNIPKLLQRCMDSIPRREDVQIIIVDDNSDPEKVNFEQFPGLNDPFVKVIFTKEGKGAGYARNVGLTKATGKWLLFADADDYFNYCINDLLDEYVNYDADIIYFKHNSVDCNTYTTAYRCISFNNYIDYWLNYQKKAYNLLKYKRSSIWAAFFKFDFIKKKSIFFDEVSIANDVSFAYLSGFYASSIHADPRAIYCTTIRQGSIRHDKKNIEKIFDDFYVVCKRYRFYKDNHIPISTDISHINNVINYFFHNKIFFIKAMNTLFNLGYTSGEIKRLCIYNILIYIPKKILKLFLFLKKMI